MNNIYDFLNSMDENDREEFISRHNQVAQMWEIPDIDDIPRFIYAFMTGGMGVMKEVTLSDPNEPDVDKAMLTITWKDHLGTMKEFREIYASHNGLAWGIGSFDDKDQRRFGILVQPEKANNNEVPKVIFCIYDNSEISKDDADCEIDDIYSEYDTIGMWYYDESKDNGGLLEGEDDDPIDKKDWHFKCGEHVLFRDPRSTDGGDEEDWDDEYEDDEDDDMPAIREAVIVECRRRVAIILYRDTDLSFLTDGKALIVKDKVSYDYLDDLSVMKSVDENFERLDIVKAAYAELDEALEHADDIPGEWERIPTKFESGEKVKIIHGPMAGKIGAVKQCAGKNVLIYWIIGQKVYSAWIDDRFLERAGT